jgi:hypothetical protein
MLYRFYAIDSPVIDALLYPTGAFVVFLVTFLIEPTYRKKRLFTLMAAVNVLLFAIFPDSTVWVLLPIGWMAWSLAFFVTFVLFLYRNTGGIVRKRILLLFTSCILFFAGWIGSMDDLQKIIPSESLRAVSLFFSLLGLIGFYAAFYQVNIFIEAGWRDALEELYIIHAKLLQPLYYQNLKTAEGNQQEKVAFFSGSLVGVNDILKTIGESQVTSKAGVSLIAQKDRYLLVEHGFNVIVCFICNKNLNSLRFYLRQIRAAWERYYSSRPIDWGNAQREIFGAMEVIVNRILQGGQV